MLDQLDLAVAQAIEALGIACEVLPCNPEWADTELFCAHYNIPREQAANAILIASKGDPRHYAVCLVLATTRIDVNHAVSRLMGIKRLSFASAEEAKAVTGQEIGGVTPFGLPDSIPVYVDAQVMNAGSVIIGGGNRSSKIRLAPQELRKIPGVVAASITRQT